MEKFDYSPYYYCNFMPSKRKVKLSEKTRKEPECTDICTEWECAEPECADICIPVTGTKLMPQNKHSRRTALAFLIVIICFCVTLLATDLISGGYFLSDISAASGAEHISYYAVETGVYSDYKTAGDYSLKAIARGGGGYTIQDKEGYHVILAVYPDKKQAEDIVKKLNSNGDTAKLYIIGANEFSGGNLSEAGKKAALDSLAYINIIYEELYNLSNEYDKETITYTAAKDKTGLLIQQVTEIQNRLSTESRSLPDIVFTKIKAETSAAVSQLKSILMSSPEMLSAKIRYVYTSCLVGYCNLLNSL